MKGYKRTNDTAIASTALEVVMASRTFAIFMIPR